MERGTVQLKRVDDIAYVTLNRPHRLNAVSAELADDLASALESISTDVPGAVIVRGAGRAFCSGYDLKESVSDGDYLSRVEQIERIQDVTRLLRRITCPVIACVRGYALGAGCEIALGCDLIVAEKDAAFGFPEVGVGLGITGGITELLPRVVGPARAKWLVFFSERISAQDALMMGLINIVVDEDQLDQTCDEVAGRVTRLPRFALGMAKRQLNSGSTSGLEEVLAYETAGAIACQESQAAVDAAAEFQSGKRKTTLAPRAQYAV